jgi:SAM-dependent methyltransferase
MSRHPVDSPGPTAVDASSIAAYWAAQPQSYADEHGGTEFRAADGSVIKVERRSPEYFREADRILFEWNRPCHDRTGPFGRLFPYERYKSRRVLEVGCGQGGMAALWAERGAQVTAVDLNPDAIGATRERFAQRGLPGEIRQVDARELPFDDATFDYAYSWGVLHHSPDLARSVGQLMRVLKSGGEFGVMLYNRHSLLYWYQIVYLEGLLHAERRFLSPLQLASRYTDGDRHEGNPHTWPVTAGEMRHLFGPYSARLDVRVLGVDIEPIVALMMPGAAKLVPRIVWKSWARRLGWSLWITGERRA